MSGDLPAVTNALSTVAPPPRNDVFQPSGAPATERSTRRSVVVLMVSANDAVPPGSTRTAGKGVEISRPVTARAAGATAAIRTRDARTATEARAADADRWNLRGATDMRGLRDVVTDVGAPARGWGPTHAGADDTQIRSNRRAAGSRGGSPR